jgi:hypothetical protein
MPWVGAVFAAAVSPAIGKLSGAGTTYVWQLFVSIILAETIGAFYLTAFHCNPASRFAKTTQPFRESPD